MLNYALQNYLSKAKGLPFFYVVGDGEYGSILDEIKISGVQELKLSKFCNKDDKFPDLDAVIDYLLTADVNFNSNKWVIVGLGEYLALRGEAETEKTLQRLKTTTLGNARVVILLRSVAGQVKKMLSSDIKLQSQNRVFVSESPVTNINISCSNVDLSLCKKVGIKYLIEQFEQGKNGTLYVDTQLDISNSILPIEHIKTSYDGIKTKVYNFRLPETAGTDDQWTRFLKELSKFDNSIDKVFASYGVDEDFENDFYEKAIGNSYENWLYFVAVKSNLLKIKNKYLRFVLETTETFDQFKNNVLVAICNVSHKDRIFKELYADRKKLVKDFDLTDIEYFIGKNSIKLEESIYNLTDNTLLEKQAILDWVAKYGMNDIVMENYPALGIYLKLYNFNCGSNSQIFTEYFDLYKRQKVGNYIDSNFIMQLPYYSKKYSSLDTRDNALQSLSNDTNVFLFWIDALGVEYLAYITEIAKRKGLQIKVDIARAELPTITLNNKGFYESWSKEKRYKEERLDDVKHDENGGYSFENCKTPIHLAKELEILDEVIGRIANKLSLRECSKVVIASDHGASRLAVINEVETKIPTETKGEHSGRCCKAFDECALNNVVEENGYFVLTDYSRFAGSRKANVEVHGGASLEEIIVPIITLSLKSPVSLEIQVLGNDEIYLDRKNGVTLNLYISTVENKNQVRLVINNKPYIAQCIDKKHFTIQLPDIKRAKIYEAEIYDGDNLIGEIKFTVKNKLGGNNSDFDDLF